MYFFFKLYNEQKRKKLQYLLEGFEGQLSVKLEAGVEKEGSYF